eukprot:1160827-Pelagomonas_calceolata.AAC.23
MHDIHSKRIREQHVCDNCLTSTVRGKGYSMCGTNAGRARFLIQPFLGTQAMYKQLRARLPAYTVTWKEAVAAAHHNHHILLFKILSLSRFMYTYIAAA